MRARRSRGPGNSIPAHARIAAPACSKTRMTISVPVFLAASHYRASGRAPSIPAARRALALPLAPSGLRDIIICVGIRQKGRRRITAPEVEGGRADGVAPSPQCLGGLLRAAAAPPNAAMRRRANLSRAPRGRRQSRQVRSANLRLRGGLLHHLVFDGRSRGAAYARGAECVGRARAHGLHRLVCRRCVWVREEVDPVRILLQRRVLSSICFQRNTSTQQHFAARENP